MAELREILYRVRLRDGSRAPALVHQFVPESATLAVETIAANLDARRNIWRLVQVQGTSEELRRIESAFRAHREKALVEHRVVARGPRVLLLWYKYAARHDRGLSLTRLAFDLLGPETVVTDRTVGGALEVRVLAPAGKAMGPFLRRLEAEAGRRHDFRLLYVGPPRIGSGAGLLPVEEAAVSAAHETGFFEVPRRGSMRELARRLGCSPSAASARLRRGLAKLAAAHASPVTIPRTGRRGA